VLIWELENFQKIKKYVVYVEMTFAKRLTWHSLSSNN